jgi:hypothetical protein
MKTQLKTQDELYNAIAQIKFNPDWDVLSKPEKTEVVAAIIAELSAHGWWSKVDEKTVVLEYNTCKLTIDLRDYSYAVYGCTVN